MNDPLKDFALKSLNISEDKFAEIVYSDAEKTTLKPDALDSLLALDAERIKTAKQVAKDRETELHDKGYNKAKAEALAKFETNLREQFGITETTLQGLDLVKEIVSKTSKTAEIDEEKVKLHPLYLQMERKLGTEYVPKADYDKVQGEFDGYKSNVERDKVLTVVLTDAIREFRGLKPVLPKDPTKARNQEDDFANKLKTFEYEVQSDGNHIIKVDGKRLENAQGHPIGFKDFVKTQAERFYEFEQQIDRGNAGNDNRGGSGSVKVPTNEAEYQQAIVNETDPMERVKIKRAYEASKK